MADDQSTTVPASVQETYRDFLAKKSQFNTGSGFEPVWLPDFLFDFQRHLVEWAVRRGRAAIFASCGLGKTPMFLTWAENVVRKTNRPVIVATTLGDSKQCVQEAAKFQVDAVRSRDGKVPAGARVVVTNYERLHLFNPRDFSGAVANESSILKNFKGKRKAVVTEFFRELPYRLLCTATAAPNDYIELGTSSEALGELGYQDMLTRYFIKQLADRGTIGWGRDHYRMKGHAERSFWQWVCSWSRACRRPSDLGFSDEKFTLPPLTTSDHVVEARNPRSGFLFDLPAFTMDEQREELNRTLTERCELVAKLVNHNKPALAWCYLNAEGNLLTKMIPGAVQVSGADSDDEKEEKIEAFISGQVKKLVSKPKIMGFGLNFQHCSHMTFFPSHSWEMWHQAVRRCWRFGQTSPVQVDVVTTPGMLDVLDNLKHKEVKVDRMFSRMVALMNDALSVDRSTEHTVKEEVPSWLV